MLVGYMNLLSVTRDKKVANISSMHAPMDEMSLLPSILDMALVSSLSTLGVLKAYMNLFM
ncbi:hypothetical protein Goklo_004502 [Gossypium klotzschianum]|uniref:Uncharacterized protein n=1 Tax=Gossypium klotzschianum TaxID=34286 RepID=A0A7J8VP40_9ROSI|nr:hypothetical protein [Gossypium klotzschianum]